MKTVGIIPARYGSTRFPGKPIAMISGKPLIQWVVEQAKKAEALSDVIVATDDERIREVASRFCRVEMTRSDHPSGTDRIAEVAERLDCEAVVNIQGDEPLIDPQVINQVAFALKSAGMSTAATPITAPEELDNPNVVKVVVNSLGFALYFSRYCIPYLRDAAGRPAGERLAAFNFLKHLGIYGYRRDILMKFVMAKESPLEKAERLEQLRALEMGISIAVVKTNARSIGVDTPEDVKKVEAFLAGMNSQQ